MPIQSRRRFLTNAALAGATGLGGFGKWGKALAAEPPPEVTTIRFEKDAAACIAPQASPTPKSSSPSTRIGASSTN
jgi:hypothetical protein